MRRLRSRQSRRRARWVSRRTTHPGGFDLGDLKNGRAAFTAATPDADQGYDLSGLDLSVLNGIRGYEHQDQYLKGLALAALAGGTTKSVKVQPESRWQSPIGQPANNTPGGILRAAKSVTAGSTAAAIKALQRRSVALDAAYRKLYPGAYSQALPKSGKAAVWKFPACSPSAAAEYDSYIYSGDPCIWTGPAATAPTIVLAPAIESGVISRSPVSRMNPVVCNGQSEYEYVYSGCTG